MSKHSPAPPFVLHDLISKNISEANVKELEEFLLSFEKEKCKSIINTHLKCYNDRTAVHETAAKNLVPFLKILLKNGGEHEYSC